MQQSSYSYASGVSLQLPPRRQTAAPRSVSSGRGHGVQCAADGGLQLPKWSQQKFLRNLPYPNRVCDVSSKVEHTAARYFSPLL